MLLAPVLLELPDRHARLALDEADALRHARVRPALHDHVVLGDQQAHRDPVDELGFVDLDRGHFLRVAQRAQRLRVVEPDLGDTVVGRLALLVALAPGVRLDVAAQAGQLPDDLGMLLAPIGLKLDHRHAGAAFEVSDGSDHGRLAFATRRTEWAIRACRGWRRDDYSSPTP